MRRWREGGLLIAIPFFTVPRVLQIMENELCQEHQNHIKKTLSWSLKKFWGIVVLSIISLCKHFFKMKVIFIQGAFKNIQGLLWKIQGLFKDIPQYYFSISRTFQGHNAFSRTFQGPCEPCMSDCVIDLVFSGVLKHYTHPWYHLKKGLILGVKTCETHEWHKTMNTKKPLRSQHNRAGENNS